MVRGESGVGKSVLLDYVADRATGCRVARAGGVESEMELPLAGLQQLVGAGCSSGSSISRRRNGRRCGWRSGCPRDLRPIGSCSASPRSAFCPTSPTSGRSLCVVDDVQWLDRESAEVLSFVARRLEAEPVAMVFAVREPSDVQELAGCPELVVEGLGDERRARAARVRDPGGPRRAGARPDRCRDPRQSARAARAPARIDRHRAGGRVRRAGRPRPSPAHRGELSCAGSRRSRRTRVCCCWSRLRSRSATRC